MTEFTSEFIAEARDYIETYAATDYTKWLLNEALDHIERLQKRVEEVEDNREHVERLLCDAEKHIAELEQELEAVASDLLWTARGYDKPPQPKEKE